MQERICPSCRSPCYSAAAEAAVWRCPHCGATILPSQATNWPFGPKAGPKVTTVYLGRGEDDAGQGD